MIPSLPTPCYANLSEEGKLERQGIDSFYLEESSISDYPGTLKYICRKAYQQGGQWVGRLNIGLSPDRTIQRILFTEEGVNINTPYFSYALPVALVWREKAVCFAFIDGPEKEVVVFSDSDNCFLNEDLSKEITEIKKLTKKYFSDN